MFHSKLFWRLYAGYVVIFLLTAIILGVLITDKVNTSNLQEVQRSLATQCELLAQISKTYLLDHSNAEPLNSASMRSLQQNIVQLYKSTQSRLTIISANGTVLADSHAQPAQMGNHGGRPEIIDAQTHGAATVTRFSQILQQQMIYQALRLEDNSKTIGFVRISLPQKDIDDKLAQLRMAILFAIGIAATAVLILGYFFARRFITPVLRISELADSVSRGEYSKRITTTRKDELTTLTDAINRMARSSAQNVAEITADRNRLAEIFAGMVEGVIGVDRQQNIIHINQAAAGLLELSMTACIDKPIWQEVRIEEITKAMEQAVQKQDVIRTQMRRLSKSEELVVDIYAAALTNEEGEEIGAVIVLHDKSDVDHLERIRRDFAANASHELKTPITAIRGLTETILDDAEMDPSTRRSFMEKIHIQSLRLSSLVTDLMTLSRLESDENEDIASVFNLVNIVKQSIKAAKHTNQGDKLSLSAHLAQEKISVYGDAQAMSQMLDNLIDNALKYTPEGGQVKVSLSTEKDKAIISVEDTGIGINPQFQARIFERFYRVDKARSRDLGGTGLGLSIVKNIVEQHKGSISLESQLGKGSKFTVTLPIFG
ncbi:MAG: cell wall metabolism sensor histidine kinase WalK [Pseudomonadales bacterium]|nr:cell wall metabolism sensor histidine kinase WalK [Pseudomonadales bacterium]